MAELPKVSVILTGAPGASAAAAADSVLSQSLRGFELLIVEEGPPDRGPGGDYRAASGDPRIRLLFNPRPGNAAEALNHGIRESSAPWLLWLDADARLQPGMLEACLSLVEGNPAVSIAYTDILDPGPSGRTRVSGEYDFESLKRTELMPDCALFSKRAWTDVGGFRTNMPNGEAWDFWIACGSRGFTGRRIPSPLLQSAKGSGQDRLESPVARDVRIAQMRVNNRECYAHEETQAAELLLGRLAGAGSRPSFNMPRIPMVTVVIPTYNRSDTLRIAVESVQAQTFRDFEIVVVSDSGSNELEQMIKDMNVRQNITYVRHGLNRGLGASRNTGVGATRGKYIAYLDDDDFFYPDHLETLVGYLEKTGEKVAYTDAYRIWQHKVDGAYREFRRDTPYMRDFDYDLILVHNFVPVLCFLHARECLREVGVFDETLSTHEDWDLWIRMSRKYRMNRIPKFTSAFTHREDGSNMSSRRKTNFLDTTVAIYGKHPEFVEDNAEIRAARDRTLAQMRLDFGIPEAAPAARTMPSGHAQALEKLKAGDAEGAVAALAALAGGGGGDARLHSDLAAAYSAAGRPVQAEIHFRKALALDADFAPASRDFGALCLRQGRLAEALDLLRKAYQLAAWDGETSMLLGELSEAAGQAEVAGQFYQRALELEPNHARARAKLSAPGAAGVPRA